VNLDSIIEARRLAEAAVAEMPDGPPKIAALQTILASLLERSGGATPKALTQSDGPALRPSQETGPRGRILSLTGEGFFAEPRSLPEIQEALAQRGWHYPQQNLGTPLTRLVRDHSLRRLRAKDGTKKLWKYSLY
jgi:hypothetical protein